MAEFLRLKLMPLEKKLKATQSEWPRLKMYTNTHLERGSVSAAHFHFPGVMTSFSSFFVARSSKAQETNPGAASQQTIHHQVRSGHH